MLLQDIYHQKHSLTPSDVLGIIASVVAAARAELRKPRGTTSLLQLQQHLALDSLYYHPLLTVPEVRRRSAPTRKRQAGDKDTDARPSTPPYVIELAIDKLRKQKVGYRAGTVCHTLCVNM